MSYATQADLAARFGQEELLQLTDRTRAGLADASVIASALSDASAAIDAYLAARYAVPVMPAPMLLRRIACDLARFYLHGDTAGEQVRQAYVDGLRMLRELADGTAVLPGAAPATAGATPAAGGRVLASDLERRWGRQQIGDFQ